MDSFRPALTQTTFRGTELHFGEAWNGHRIQISPGKILGINIPVRFHLEIPDANAVPNIFLPVTWQGVDAHLDAETFNRVVENWLIQTFDTYQGNISGITRTNRGKFLIVANSPEAAARIVQKIIDTFGQIEIPDDTECETKIITRNPGDETLLLVERFRAEVDAAANKLEATARLSRMQLADKMEPAYPTKLIRIERARKALADYAAGKLETNGRAPYDVLSEISKAWKTVKIPLNEREAREEQIKREWGGDSSLD